MRLVAYGNFQLVKSFDTDWLAWDRAGPHVAGGAIAVIGAVIFAERCCRR